MDALGCILYRVLAYLIHLRLVYNALTISHLSQISVEDLSYESTTLMASPQSFSEFEDVPAE